MSSGYIRIALQGAMAAFLLAVLAWQLLELGPTSDPDPDGYVSYAKALLSDWSLQPHRRLPAYPALLALIDSIGSETLHIKGFWLHFFLTIAFVLASYLLVLRPFGGLVATVFLALLTYNSYFPHDAIVMVADLPFVIVFLAACAAGLGLFTSTGARRLALAGAFFLLFLLSDALHPSSHLRIQILCASALVILVAQALISGKKGAELGRQITTLAAISVMAFIGNLAVLRFLQVESPQPYIVRGEESTTSSNFLTHWVAYRMFLCLPPAEPATTDDAGIEAAKRRAAERLGYPVEAVVPPGMYPELAEYFAAHKVSSDAWRPRLLAHPLALVSCTLSEIKHKYHFIIRNLVPFTSFAADKSWVTPAYPRDDDADFKSWLFWRTGLSLPTLPSGASAFVVAKHIVVELGFLLTTLVATIGGLLMLDKRWPPLGWVMIVSTVVFSGVIASVLPLETRYYMPQLPVFYLAQAIFAAAGLRWIAWKVRRKFA